MNRNIYSTVHVTVVRKIGKNVKVKGQHLSHL